MSFITIVLFFIYTWGFGFTITSFLKNSENFLERNLMRIGIGLGVIPILSVLLNLIRVPLDWRIILSLSLVFPLFYSIKNFKKIHLKSRFKLTKSNLYILIVLIMFASLSFMYLKGSFGYPWLEDGDPWLYSTAVKYVAVHKTYSKPVDMFRVYEISHYTEPYPIAYTVVMGILHQTSPSIKWTLKFFNSLMLSLSVIFFYFFVKEFSDNRNIALAASFVFMVIPSFLGHFIFSQVLGVVLFFPALYSLERIKQDRKWAFAAIIITASIMISQLVTAAVFGTIFFITYLIVIFFKKKNLWKYVFLVGFFGLLLSFAYWGDMINKFGYDGVRYQNSMGTQKAYKVGGSLGDIYSLDDFVYAAYYGNTLFNLKWNNAIDGPIGLGLFLSLLLFFSVIIIIIQYKKIVKGKMWLLISVCWLILNYINIRSGGLPIGFVPHRSWTFFAIPVSIVVGYGIIYLMSLLKNFKINKLITLVIVVTLLLITSGYPKYVVNTVLWPQHKFIPDPNGELGGYLWLENLPINTMVTSLCRNDHVIIGLDKMSTAQWDREQIDFKLQLVNKSAEEISLFLKKNKYQYAIMDSKCIERLGVNGTNSKLSEMFSSGLFTPVLPKNIQGIFVFKLS